VLSIAPLSWWSLRGRWPNTRDGYTDYLARNDLPELPVGLESFEDCYVAHKKRLARRLAEVLGADPDAAEELVVVDEDESLAEEGLDI